MGWIIFGIVLGLFLLGLLFLPVRLFIQTAQDEYRLEIGHLLRTSVEPATDDLLLRLRILFWKKEWSLLKLFANSGKTTNGPEPSEKKETKRRKARHISWRRIQRLLRSFHVRRLQLSLDTDDYVTNAWLWPVLFFLNGKDRKLEVNFRGKNELDLWIENRPVWILLALIKPEKKKHLIFKP